MELVRMRSHWSRVGFNTVMVKYGPRDTERTQYNDEAREWAYIST